MSLDTLKERLPAYAKDLKINLGNLSRTAGFTPQQLWGTILASAIASRNPEVIRALARESEAHLSPEARDAVKAAAAIMGMNNIYYRFVHLCGDPEIQKLPARLRMTVIGNPGVDKLDFELWSLAASAVNGCGSCIASHQKVVMDKGATREMVQDVARIAAVVHGVAVTLETEDAMAEAGLEAAA
jgi:lipoyl-dependent peroxiredoxin subunit D